MPLKRMLDDNRTFDPKTIVLLLEAFDAAVAELDLRTLTDRERTARTVIELAHRRPRIDAVKIREDVVRLMRKEGIGRRRPF